MIASILSLALATAAFAAPPAAQRPDRGSYTAPDTSTVLVDFTDGTHTVGAEGDTGNDIVTGAGFPNEACGEATIGPDGLTIAIPAGLSASAYCSAKWEPGRVGLPDVDLSGGDGEGNDYVAIEMQAQENASQYNYVSLWFVPDSGSNYTGVKYCNKAQGAGAQKRPAVHSIISKLSVDTWTCPNGEPPGWPNHFTAVKRIELRYVVHASAAGFPTTIKIKRIFKGKPPSLVALTFDNTFEGVYDYAFPLLSSYGIKGTTFNSGGDWVLTGRYSPAELAEMSAAGWTVGGQEYLDNEDVNSYRVASGGLVCSGGVATWTEPTTGTLKQCSACSNERPQVGDTVTVVGALDPKWNGPKAITAVQSGTSTPYFQFACPDSPTTPATGNISATRLTREQFNEVFGDTLAEPNIRAAGGKPYWSYSNGRHNLETMGWARDQGIRLARTTSTGAPPNAHSQDTRTLRWWQARLALNSSGVDESTTEDILANVAPSVLYGGLLNINAHDLVSAASCSPCGQSEADEQEYEDAFTQRPGGMVEMWRQGLIDFVTYDELYNRLF